MSETLVLDASAILCLLNAEKGADRVAGALPNSVASAVNISEVAAKLADYGMDLVSISLALAPLHLDIVAFDEQQAMAAGALRPATRAFGLSFGDRACLALAAVKGATALTADRAWADAQSTTGISIEILR